MICSKIDYLFFIFKAEANRKANEQTKAKPNEQTKAKPNEQTKAKLI